MRADDEAYGPPSRWLEGARCGLCSQRGMAAVAWMGGVLSVVLLAVETRLSVLHPASVLFLLLIAMTFAPGLIALAATATRIARGRRRNLGLAWTLAAIFPAIVWVAWGGYAFHQFNTRQIPRNLPMRLIEMAGASVMEARALYLSPHRLETSRLIMFYGDGLGDPRQDAADLDRHVARMEALTGLPIRAKIFLVRAPVLGERHVAFRGLAFGSPQGHAGYVDLHELAHAVMAQHEQPDTDPPTLLSEGWAESQSRSPGDLTNQALAIRQLVSGWSAAWPKMTEPQRQELLSRVVDQSGIEHLVRVGAAHGGTVPSFLRELTGDIWYHRDTGPVYPVGGAFSNYLLRTFGAGRFVQLYFACRPGQFDQECQRVLGTDIESLERRFWKDQEHIARGTKCMLNAQPMPDSPTASRRTYGNYSRRRISSLAARGIRKAAVGSGIGVSKYA